MLNQLDVKYDPKSAKPVLEQLLLQTIKAQGYNGPKSNTTKISEFVHNAVQAQPSASELLTTKNEQNNEQNNEQDDEQDDEQELIQLQQQRIKATQELKLAAEKLDGINKQIELRQQVTKLQELTNQLANDRDKLNEIKALDTVKKSMRNRQQINDAKRQLQELKDKQPSLEKSHKNYPTIIRDNASLKLFKDRIHDMIHEDQSPLHQESNTRKVALYSFVIIVYELPIGTKLRPEVQWFNEHDYTRSIDCKYIICWFIAASFQLHPEINNNKSRIANAIELFLQFNDQFHKEGGRLNKEQKQLLKDYAVFNQETDLEKFQQCFKLNVKTYEYGHSEKSFNKTNEYIVNQDWQTTHILLAPLSIQGDENPQVHAMFIKDIDRVVDGYLCRKCNQKLFNRTSAHFGRDLKTHIECCKGPDQQKHPKLDKLAQPFMPYLESNKTIQKLFATGMIKLITKDQEQGVSDILHPTKNYICINAETVEDQAQDDEQIYAQLQPLSLVIEWMWELANEVNEANLACEPIVKFDNENEQQKHQQKIHQVAIFGFNSKNNAYLGSTTQQKQVTIRHTDYPFELVFKDVLTFIPPTTLDNFVHKYGGVTDSNGVRRN
ncbi:MAG: hypothetical protein EZS28_029950 [Streblomastix strix]|uniref:Uncharacterized protein n=1 Tax=Streblomastix strix TaxID=222440 RepID=A0A5J4UWA4_9EUKA|nr:MAG: hypothetical protein EZS28_029950 [Streblomastix strix]